MKIIGFIIVTFAGFYAGQLLSHRLVRRVRLMTKLKLLVSTIGTQIHFTSAELYDIILDMTKRTEFSQLIFLINCVDYIRDGIDFPTAWENSIEEDDNMLLLEGEEVELLRSFGASLGTTDAEGQMGICKMYEGLMDARLAVASQKKQQCARLYTGLGTLLGIGIAILTL